MVSNSHVHIGGFQGTAGVRTEDMHGIDQVQWPLADIKASEYLLEQHRGTFAFHHVLRSIERIARLRPERATDSGRDIEHNDCG